MINDLQINIGSKVKYVKNQLERAFKFTFGWLFIFVILAAFTIAVMFLADVIHPPKKHDPVQKKLEQQDQKVKELKDKVEELDRKYQAYAAKKEQQKIQERIVATQVIKVVKPVVPKPVPPPATPVDVRGIARVVTVQWFGEVHWPAMTILINKESGFNPLIVNKYSGACGLAQFLPCNKYGTGPMNLKSVGEQMVAMCSYVKERYGTPQAALNWHLGHNWY